MWTFLIFVIVLLLIAFNWERIQSWLSGGGKGGKVAGSPPNYQVVVDIARGMEDFTSRAARPTDLLTQPEFQRAVAILSNETTPFSLLIAYYLGANAIISCMALEAITRRNDDRDTFEDLAPGVNTIWYWPREFLLRTLDVRCPAPIIGKLLARLDESWQEPIPLQMVREFISKRVPKVETPLWDSALEGLTSRQLETTGQLLQKLEMDSLAPLVSAFEEHQRSNVDITFMQSFGEVWTAQSRPQRAPIIEHEYLLSTVIGLQESMQSSSPGSVIIVGESGVGKSAILDVLSGELTSSGWVVFRCNAAGVLSGQVYLGQLEERVRTLVRQLSRKRIIWIVPNIHELAWAGSHQFSQTSILDMLIPSIEEGSIILIGETRPASYERLIQARPQLRAKFSRLIVRPLEESESRAIAGEWIKLQSPSPESPIMTHEVLQEAFQLANQYLGSKASPGNVMDFLKATWAMVMSDGRSTITVDDLLVKLSASTGLPRIILDDREELDLTHLSDFFNRRVFGQPEAVARVVERIALIKAGLTDPTRPQGVFLFSGPTGTGKTELAKTLAEYLFGSPDRMIRLDMSEFQTAESLNRLLGDSSEQSTTNSVIDQIRSEPFSVVLLDEFEKAYPLVWDIFLQVFDDGRLTDRRGSTGDFRHALIIMTSNLGSAIPSGQTLGFEGIPDRFSPGQVERAIRTTFRREFLNRIDHIIVFRPLTRVVMRELLQKELHRAFQRRGLRRREWAIEWDETALEFLLAKGFTPDLGARPLVRAIERYLLTPLAQTIVRHQFPAGDQFLYVRSDGDRILVEFIDPDAGTSASEVPPIQITGETTSDRISLQRIILSPRGDDVEVGFLNDQLGKVRSVIDAGEWRERKELLLQQSSSESVWASDERFELLGKVELMDRIEQGLKTATGLFSRASHHVGSQKRPISVLSLCAQQIYLVNAAVESLRENVPRDAYLLVETGKSSGRSLHEANDFAGRIGMMYGKWGEKRKMSLTYFEKNDGAATTPYRLLLGVSGFGAFHILQHENGLHVLEIPREGRSFDRLSVSVRVIPQPVGPLHVQNVTAEHVRQHFNAQTGRLRIVRRYRELPSPLVRDDVLHWRTGRLDAVFDGDFDLMAGI